MTVLAETLVRESETTAAAITRCALALHAAKMGHAYLSHWHDAETRVCLTPGYRERQGES